MKFHPSIVQSSCTSPLGTLTVAATSQGLAGVWFDGQKHLPLALAGAEPAWPVDTDHPVFPLENTVADLHIDMLGRVDKAHAGQGNYIYVIGDDWRSMYITTRSSVYRTRVNIAGVPVRQPAAKAAA